MMERNLRQVYFDNLLSLVLSKVRSLHTRLNDDRVETLKFMMNNLHYLESIEVECSDAITSFGVIAKYSRNKNMVYGPNPSTWIIPGKVGACSYKLGKSNTIRTSHSDH